MKNLYIDFDGVIVDSIDVTYKMIDERNININDADECLRFYQNLDWNMVLKKCKLINDSIECIRKLEDSNLFNISILTHVSSLGEIEEKVKFIRKYLKNITIIPVPKSISKTNMLKAQDSILVDDYVVNLEEWKSAGGIGIRFDLDMDGKGFPVVDRLDDIFKIVF